MMFTKDCKVPNLTTIQRLPKEGASNYPNNEVIVVPGHHKKRPDGRWDLIIEVGKNPTTGKRKRNRIIFEGTETQAIKELAKLITEVDKGIYIPPSKTTFGEYAAAWLEDHVQAKLSPITYKNYKNVLNLRIIPWLGVIKLDKLAPADLRKFYKRLAEEGKVKGEGNLSKAAIKLHEAVIHSVLQTAFLDELVSRNVAKLAKPVYPNEYLEETNEDKIKILNEQEVKTLENLLFKEWHPDYPYYEIVFMDIRTGLRRGEILALKWSDIDLKQGLLKVQRSLVYSVEKGCFFKKTKNKQSRAIDISNEVVTMLKKLRKKQLNNMLALGENYNKDNDLVFCKRNGDSLFPDYMSLWFQRFLNKNGFPELTFHCLRHTHASLLLKAGVDIKIISERLGHSKIGITYDTYAHLLPGQQKDAAQKLEGLLNC